MYQSCLKWLTLAAVSIGLPASAQRTCTTGIRIEGTITDPTGAVIPGAQVQAASGEKTTSDAAGTYTLPCVQGASTVITARANGFANGAVRARGHLGGTVRVNVQLAVASVQTDVQVNADVSGIETDRGAGTTSLGTNQVQQLSDDPDDLIQQLQILASNGGGAPSSTTFVVDGFQNSSAIPPKNSIASIRINPDPYSPEYEGPTFEGGRVEITTKPGADKFHGALFFTDSDGSFNATDPFSTTPTPAGKRRYGFELSGPVVPKKSGFALALEKRDIDEFNVVNATTLDQNNNPVPFHQTVAAPQRLWIASVRGDLQLTPKDVATLAFAANVNNLGNQGVGGLALPEAGYSNLISEYDLRLTNSYTLSANLLNETRIGYTWKRTQQTPLSTGPSLEVAGYFLGGGSTAQNLNDRERDFEIDDNVMFTRAKHSLDFGAQSLGFFVHNYDPDTFNGAFVFGGGSGPELDPNNQPTGQTTTLTPIQQYQRALENLPGGSPTTYQATTGTPLVPFTQWKLALFAGDSIRVAQRFMVSAGLRYAFQTSPETFVNFAPRIAFSWAPDKKSNWVLHLRAGLFDAPAPLSYATDVYRLNGERQHSITVYSPSYNDPLTPIPGAIEITTVNQFARKISQFQAAVFNVGVEHELPHHWHPTVNFSYAQDWGIYRTRNINAPMVPTSTGAAPDPTAALLAPRPIAPNENIIQYENSGHLNGGILSMNLAQHSYKRFDLNISAWMLRFKADAPVPIGSPQSSYSNAGESSRPDWEAGGGSVSGTLNLPGRVQFTNDFSARTGTPYNITTGTDNNGDGDFNDRPSYALAPGPGVYSTAFGLLTANTVNGSVPRNLGTMPSVWHLYSNLSRAFTLNPRDKDHPMTLTLNARAANLLNHTNTTAVETVLSPNLGQPISAEAARRIEVGARFSF
jgi:hypothetical protein